MAENAPPKKSPAAEVPSREPGRVAGFKAVVARAEQGDPGALAVVREVLQGKGAPDLLNGNVAQTALLELVRSYAGDNPVVREATLRKLAELRADLSGPNSTPLEGLLVDRIVATWLHLHHLETQYASKDPMPLTVGLYFQKAITSAQKRYVAALKALAEVRKLAVPVLQLSRASEPVSASRPRGHAQRTRIRRAPIVN